MTSQERRSDGSPQPAEQEPLSIIGIGASAGGLAALRKFFEHIPADSGLTFVVVVHLSPEHKSHLAELLQPNISIPVQQVTETTPLLPNHVYVIPPNSNLSAVDSHLRLSELEPQRKDRAPIDHFFRTMARTFDGHSVGVVLTGTGSDGTLGLKEIKACGGLTIVQDPNDAEYDGMPQSAVATGLIDLILPLDQIPDAILQYSHVQPRIQMPEEGESLEEEERRLLHKIYAQIRARTGRDFSHYKRSTMLRRIGRRMQFNHVEELPDYVDLLRKNSDEARALANDLLITVTSFFRDPEVFDLLEAEVIPKLFENRTNSDNIVRVWSVGCATGEEAYSLAILLLEAAARLESPVSVQVFASDLHEHSLARAREGFYPGDIETDISEQRLKRFFQKEASGYRIRKEVRELVVFAPHNLLADPPFSRIDLITCRNLLIYLQRDIQTDVIELFHYALKPDGVLVVGTSETLASAELFRIEDKKCCVYRKRNVPAPEPRLPVFPLIRAPRTGEKENPERQAEPVSFGKLHQRMVEMYAPPSMLISPDDKIAHLSAHAGRYLMHPGGEITANIFKLVREELRIELRTALSTVRETGRPLVMRPLMVSFAGEPKPVILHVRPSLEPHHEGFALVIFEELDSLSPPSSDKADAPEITADSQRHLHELGTELNLTQQRLQSIVEEYETSQEELKASNEELQSANEELRSTMEELETSTEELQSMNEELQTVNQENRHKVEELAQLSGDLQNLLAATDIATLYLDRDLRIMRFTPKVTDLFSVRMTDRGRPLSNFTHRLGYDQMQHDARKVLAELTPIEREVQDEEGRWYLTRIRPYRSADDRIEGVVATFIEITSRKQAEANLRRNEQQFRTLVEQTKDYAIFVADPAGVPRTWNVGVERVLGFRESEFLGRDINKLIFTPEDQAEGIPEQELQTAAEAGSASNDRWMLRKDGTRFWASGITTALCGDQGELIGYMKVMRDHTGMKQMEEELRRITDDLVEANRRKDEFLATLAHELRNPLSPIRSGLDLIKIARNDEELVDTALLTIERQSQQLIRLVDDLLDVSRITRGRLELRCRILPLAEVLETAIEAVQPFIEESGHGLTVDIPETEIFVHADPNRLAQIFANLLNNAAKYTPDGGHIELAVRRENDQVCIDVKDDGVGIAPDMLAHIFEMFGQVSRAQERGGTGLGIGLTLVKSLVEMHGGTVSVHSDGRNKGSQFTVRLPVLSGVSSAYQGPHLENMRVTPVRKLRVLVVDDNRHAAQMLGTLIQRLGHEVRTASDGLDAIEQAAAFLPQVILMDLGMPRMNGYDSAKHIRLQNWGQEIILVALTGWGQEADRARTREAGFNYHLVKPAERTALEKLFVDIAAQRPR